MTATPSWTRSETRPAARSATRRTIRCVLYQQRVLAWFFGIVAVLATAATILENTFGQVQVSHLQFARTGGLWFLFTLGIVTVVGMLTTHVAAGGTRRSFVAATLAVGLGSALVYALALGVGLEIEGAVYAANGWPHAALEGEADPSAGIAVTFPPAVVSYAAGTVSGLLVGLSYYRFGGLRGTVVLPVALAPILFLTVSGLDDGTSRALLEAADLPFGLSLLVDAAVLSAAIAAYYVLARRVPVRQAAT